MIRSSLVIASVLSMLNVMGASVSRAADPDALELELSTDKKVYVAYEPVIVTFTLRNISTKDFDVGSISFPTGTMRLEIADEGKIYRPYGTGPEPLTYPARRMLPPGGAIVTDLVVLTNSLGVIAAVNPGVYKGIVPFPFSRPGKYSLRAYTLGVAGGVAVSSVVEIRVGAGDPAASPLSFFPSIEDYAASVGADYYTPLSRETVGRWESFVRKNPRSVFAPFVALGVGALYLHGTGLPEPDPARAAELFTIAARTAPRRLRDECLLGLAEAQVAAGNPTQARRSVDRILRADPSSDTGARARRIRDGLINGVLTLRGIYSR